MQDETIVSEFTHQAESFNRSAVARSQEILDAIVGLAAPDRSQRWLEAACGPGIVSRAFAGGAGSVHGVDMTPAMIATARREAAIAGATNVTFEVGDATALMLEDASFDGAVARFTVHHVPVPARLTSELARVVRPGGTVVLADHIADEDADAAAWALEIERVRDPSHWACLPRHRLRGLGEHAGLALERELIIPIELDFDDWVLRGSRGAAASALIARLISERPAGTPCFRLSGKGRERRIELQMWLGRWRRQKQPSS